MADEEGIVMERKPTEAVREGRAEEEREEKPSSSSEASASAVRSQLNWEMWAALAASRSSSSVLPRESDTRESDTLRARDDERIGTPTPLPPAAPEKLARVDGGRSCETTSSWGEGSTAAAALIGSSASRLIDERADGRRVGASLVDERDMLGMSGSRCSELGRVRGTSARGSAGEIESPEAPKRPPPRALWCRRAWLLRRRLPPLLDAPRLCVSDGDTSSVSTSEFELTEIRSEDWD